MPEAAKEVAAADPTTEPSAHLGAALDQHHPELALSQIRGQIADGSVAHFQVSLKVGFRLDDVS